MLFTLRRPIKGGHVVGIGLIGAGRIGTLHAHTIAASTNSRLVAVYDSDHAVAQRLTSELGGEACRSVNQLAERGDVDAVFICSPTDTHVDIVTAAAAAKKAIFCEKPIDLNISRVRECLDILKRNPVLFTLGFHRRFDPHHRLLREEVRRGRIGAIEQIRIVSRDPTPPPIEYVRRSGGIFRDMMIHDLDQCRALLGREFSKVFAVGSVLIDPQIQDAADFDTATATLWTKDGVTCTIQNSRRCSYGFDQRIEIFGSKGRLALDNVPITNTSVFDESGLVTPCLPRHFPQRYRDAYRHQLDAFVLAVEGKAPPETTAEDGFWSLALADAADRAARASEPTDVEQIHVHETEV
jgi:myo-inositol 2-dehydrogenase / D-chiro-inositol 1-dehydrogenase